MGTPHPYSSHLIATHAHATARQYQTLAFLAAPVAIAMVALRVLILDPQASPPLLLWLTDMTIAAALVFGAWWYRAGRRYARHAELMRDRRQLPRRMEAVYHERQRATAQRRARTRAVLSVVFTGVALTSAVLVLGVAYDPTKPFLAQLLMQVGLSLVALIAGLVSLMLRPADSR